MRGRWWRPVVLIALPILFVSLTLGLALGFLIRSSNRAADERTRLLEQIAEIQQGNRQSVADHRTANQHDHDCIISLALLLANRDRDEPVEFTCERIPENDAEEHP